MFCYSGLVDRPGCVSGNPRGYICAVTRLDNQKTKDEAAAASRAN